MNLFKMSISVALLFFLTGCVTNSKIGERAPSSTAGDNFETAYLNCESQYQAIEAQGQKGNWSLSVTPHRSVNSKSISYTTDQNRNQFEITPVLEPRAGVVFFVAKRSTNPYVSTILYGVPSTITQAQTSDESWNFNAVLDTATTDQRQKDTYGGFSQGIQLPCELTFKK